MVAGPAEKRLDFADIGAAVGPERADRSLDRQRIGAEQIAQPIAALLGLDEFIEPRIGRADRSWVRLDDGFALAKPAKGVGNVFGFRLVGEQAVERTLGVLFLCLCEYERG